MLQSLSSCWVIGSECVFEDRHNPLHRSDGFIDAAEALQRQRYVAECDGDLGVVGGVYGFLDGEGAVESVERSLVVTQPSLGDTDVGECGGDLVVVGGVYGLSLIHI